MIWIVACESNVGDTLDFGFDTGWFGISDL